MDIIKTSIGFEFIHTRMHLTWREIHYGLVSDLLAPGAPVWFAVDQVASLDKPSEDLVALASRSPESPTLDLVVALANKEPPRPDSELRRKWLLLVLAWLYEFRNSLANPLQKLEEVYADFDYPEEIAHLIRYMPKSKYHTSFQGGGSVDFIQLWGEFVKKNVPFRPYTDKDSI